jgi:hypothetical protein
MFGKVSVVVGGARPQGSDAIAWSDECTNESWVDVEVDVAHGYEESA